MKKTHRLSLIIIWVFLHAAAATAQERLRLYISADMEGVVGAVTEEQLGPSGFEYPRFREFMTREVNAAIDGAREAGATEIVISDSHGNGQNLLIEQLPKDVLIIRSRPRPLMMMQGIDGSFDGAIFLGYHASTTSIEGVRAHTLSSARLADVRLNGISMPEAGINAAIAGHSCRSWSGRVPTPCASRGRICWRSRGSWRSCSATNRRWNPDAGRRPPKPCAAGDSSYPGDLGNEGFVRRLFSILGLLLWVGCGGDGQPSEPAIPSVRGTYDARWAIDVTTLATGETRTLSCGGVLRVTLQEDRAFSGDFAIFGTTVACRAFEASGTISGTVDLDGGLEFDIDVPGQRPNDFENLTGCEFVSGETRFRGTVSATDLRASVIVVIECTDPEGNPERLRVRFAVIGTKVE